MKKRFSIFGRTFEYKGTTVERSYNDRDLSECYARPSEIKQAIWKDWSIWFVAQCGSINFGVSSYNQQFFTITGYIILDGHYWYLEITPKHNRAWLVVED